jgi:hypothetical protein
MLKNYALLNVMVCGTDLKLKKCDEKKQFKLTPPLETVCVLEFRTVSFMLCS